jgi:hypothetical protein
MQRPSNKLDDIDPDIQNYIWWLESKLNGYTEFQKEMSNTMNVLADDLRLANAGATSGYKLLSGNKDDKIFERIMTMIKMQNQMKSASLVETEEAVIKKKKTNIQDFVVKR